jgi:hypothetical protein
MARLLLCGNTDVACAPRCGAVIAGKFPTARAFSFAFVPFAAYVRNQRPEPREKWKSLNL